MSPTIFGNITFVSEECLFLISKSKVAEISDILI